VSKTERLIGLTPMIKRIAYHYLRLGEGIYTPAGGNHPHYDKIVVRELYEFRENPKVEGERAGGMIVEFFKDGHRIRWVDFRCQVTGGGGEVIIKRIK
jgi:hypothetical protein